MRWPTLAVTLGRNQHMACEIVSCRGAVFVLWGVPSTEDVDRIVLSLRAAVEQAGEPVVFVTRVPIDQPAPSAEVRRYLNESMPALLALISSYHAVLEGDGFTAAVKRAVLLGLFQLTWRRGVFSVHSRVADVPSVHEPKQRAATQRLLELARARGLLDASGPTSGSALLGAGR